MATRVALLGFDDDGTQPDDVITWPMTEATALPEVAIIGLFFDRAKIEPEPTNLRRIDVTKALDRGATIVVFFGPGVSNAAASAFGEWLLSLLTPLGLSMTWSSPANLISESKSLQPYFEDHITHAYINLVPQPDEIEVLARRRPGGPDELVTSVRVQVGKSTVLLVPLRSPVGSTGEAVRFLSLMDSGEEYPPYLDVLDLGGEVAARSELEQLQHRQRELEAGISSARRAKRILYFKDTALQREAVRFLGEELGISARDVPGFHEDFHLVKDETEDAWCIGEVKGRETVNVKKADVGAVTIHRSDAGLEDDFPALLVVNTFRQRPSVESRDEPVHPDVVRRAAEDHVVVVRTLDLVRVKQATNRGDQAPKNDLLRALREAGGWFEVSSSGEHGLRTG